MLIRALEEALGALGLRDGTLLVAVSGGVDSVVLLHGLEKLSQGWGLKLLTEDSPSSWSSMATVPPVTLICLPGSGNRRQWLTAAMP